MKHEEADANRDIIGTVEKTRLSTPSSGTSKTMATAKPPPKGRQFHCDICDRWRSVNQWSRHLDRHQRQKVSAQNRESDEQVNRQEEIVDDDAQCCQEMQAACQAAALRTQEQIESRIEELEASPMLHHTRTSVQLPLYYKEVVQHAQHGRAITPREYLHRVRGRTDSQAFEELKDCYIVTKCHERAREVLERGGLLIPMVVRGASRHRKTLESFLSHLETQDCVEAHFLDEAYDPKAQYTAPRKESGSRMATLLREPNAREINCLNLKIWKENPTPKCLLDLPDYHVLTHIRDCVGPHDAVDSGKASQVLVRDLSNCAYFHLLALTGSFSFPHGDHHGEFATIFAENKECEKMWYVFLLTKAEYRAWARAGTVAPDARPFPVLLRENDGYFQPGGTVHGPYTLSPAFMTGTMHIVIHGDSLIWAVEQSIVEFEYGHVTNEDPTLEFIGKMKVVEQLWRERRGPYTWGSEEQLTIFTQVLKDYRQLVNGKGKACCACSTGLCQNCICFTRGRGCDFCKSINCTNKP